MEVKPNGNGNGNYSQRYGVIIQTVTVVAIFIAGFWTAVVMPIRSQLDQTLPIREHEEFKHRLDDKFLDQKAELQREIEENSVRVRRLEDGIVTRGELQQIWAKDAEQVSNIQREIDELKKEFGGTFTLGDKVKELQTQLDEIRTQQKTEVK